jgi:hypothetical protein
MTPQSNTKSTVLTQRPSHNNGVLLEKFGAAEFNDAMTYLEREELTENVNARAGLFSQAGNGYLNEMIYAANGGVFPSQYKTNGKPYPGQLYEEDHRGMPHEAFVNTIRRQFGKTTTRTDTSYNEAEKFFEGLKACAGDMVFDYRDKQDLWLQISGSIRHRFHSYEEHYGTAFNEATYGSKLKGLLLSQMEKNANSIKEEEVKLSAQRGLKWFKKELEDEEQKQRETLMATQHLSSTEAREAVSKTLITGVLLKIAAEFANKWHNDILKAQQLMPSVPKGATKGGKDSDYVKRGLDSGQAGKDKTPYSAPSVNEKTKSSNDAFSKSWPLSIDKDGRCTFCGNIYCKEDNKGCKFIFFHPNVNNDRSVSFVDSKEGKIMRKADPDHDRLSTKWAYKEENGVWVKYRLPSREERKANYSSSKPPGDGGDRDDKRDGGGSSGRRDDGRSGGGGSSSNRNYYGDGGEGGSSSGARYGGRQHASNSSDEVMDEETLPNASEDCIEVEVESC